MSGLKSGALASLSNLWMDFTGGIGYWDTIRGQAPSVHGAVVFRYGITGYFDKSLFVTVSVRNV